MTAHPIDTEALRRLADAATDGPWKIVPSVAVRGAFAIYGVAPVLRARYADAEFIAAARTAVPALLDALAAAEARATRAEAQSAIRGRAIAIHRARAREAEAWIKYQNDEVDRLEVSLDRAEARAKAVRELCDRASRDAGTLERNLLGGHRLYPKEIRRALDGDS